VCGCVCVCVRVCGSNWAVTFRPAVVHSQPHEPHTKQPCRGDAAGAGIWPHPMWVAVQNRSELKTMSPSCTHPAGGGGNTVPFTVNDRDPASSTGAAATILSVPSPAVPSLVVRARFYNRGEDEHPSVIQWETPPQ
jgi:hypothetical protein